MYVLTRKNVKKPYKEEHELHDHKFYVMFMSGEWENLLYLSQKWNLNPSATLRRCVRTVFEKEFLAD